MEPEKQIDYRALIQINASYEYGRLTKQQYKTLRGQVFAGDGKAP